jgi:hypothetical protein
MGVTRAIRLQVGRSGRRTGRHSVTSLTRAARLLRASRMPADEIRTIVTTADPELARRYVELHLERLEEWLDEQRRSLASVDVLLRREATPAGSGRLAS